MSSSRDASTSATPWLLRRDWARGEVEAIGHKSNVLALGLLAGALLIGSVVCLVVNPTQKLATDLTKTAIVLVVLGACFGVGAFYVSRFREKFGQPIFRLNTLPGEIGGMLEGELVVRKGCAEPVIFDFRLRSLKRLQPSDVDAERYVKVLWETQRKVRGGGDVAGKFVVPFRALIPHDCLETNAIGGIYWELVAEAKLPGMDYFAVFEVPVFRVAESPL
jgi:hypothetical protein